MTSTFVALGGERVEIPDFSDLTLDQLANIKITSFTNKEQKLSQVAGAVYVITREQIARSGLTSVPELLRLAPGVDVARVNGNQWSISTRGPVGAYVNKLLVLIDGRSVYSPVFSGVYWEVGMPMLENIARIEVIRGPGATIWGANAVLGVVNIITESSLETHGTKLTAGVGSTERAFGGITTSGVFRSTSYRGYFAGSDSAAQSLPSGGEAFDGRRSIQAGFRLDGSHRANSWTLEGDLFRGYENNFAINAVPETLSVVRYPAHFNTFAGNFTGEWRRRMGENGELRIKSWYDLVNRPQPQAAKVETGAWDTELQYDFTTGRIHKLSVGGGERTISDTVRTSLKGLIFNPAQLTYVNLNAFAQDEMHFFRDSVLVTLGAKIERNHFGGAGLEPSANLLWMPAKRHSIWMSVARSLRTPALFDTAVAGPFAVTPPSAETAGLPVVSSFTASPLFTTEKVNDFEVGYRGQLTKAFSTDVALFYDRFSDIASAAFGKPTLVFTPPIHLNVDAATGNSTEATGKGAEASIGWQVSDALKLEGSYTYNLIDPWISPSAPPGSTIGSLKQPSRNKWRLQAYANLSKRWNLDTFLYWTSAGSPVNYFGPPIPVPAYTRLDVRLGYKVSSHWQLSLAGQNLSQRRHLEAIAQLLSSESYVNRGIYLKSTWQF